MSKKFIFYYLLLAEEGIAYYLTFKWPLILYACVIALFPTVMVCWTVSVVSNFGTNWELIFFIIWLIIMIIFFLEFRIPDSIKEKVKKKLNESE